MNFLKDNGKIALVAPSYGCVDEPYSTRLHNAINYLRNQGYTVEEGPNIYLAKDKARSNTAKKCAKEFMDAYLGDSDAVISVGGGEIMCEILPHIDFKKISKAPHKFFMGFSDNTNLTYTLVTNSNQPTIYGSCAPGFGYEPLGEAEIDSLNLLTGKVSETKGYPKWRIEHKSTDDPFVYLDKWVDKKIKTYPKGDVHIEGILLGGCLDILDVISGTRFDNTLNYIEKHKEEGIVWFLEACDLTSLDIERTLFKLKELGWFKYTKGFIMGRPLCYKQRISKINHYNAFMRILKPLHVPIIMDADLGHFYPSMPIITGVKGKVDVKDNNIFISYK